MSGVMPRSLDSRERTPVPAECEGRWTPQPVSKFRRREKTVALTGVRTPDRQARSLVAIQTELSPTMMIMMTIISILVNKLMVMEKKSERKTGGCCYSKFLCHTDDRDDWNGRRVIISHLCASATLSQTRSIASYAAIFLETTETRNVYGAVPQHGKEFSGTRDCHRVY
jgi:hypothetical protein